MPIYEYQCTAEDCGAVTERILSSSADKPDVILCKFCEQPATEKISAPAIHGVGKSGSGRDFDRAVGADAEKRWSAIHARQAQRDKVRRETGSVGIAAAGYTDFRPITEQQKQARTKATEAVARDGFRSET